MQRVQSVLIAFVIGCVWQTTQAGSVSIPDPPAEKPWLSDQAGVLDHSARNRIKQLQQRAFDEHGVAVFIVTFERKAHFGAAQLNYQQLAQRWLRKWQPAFHDNDRPGGRDLILLLGVKDRYAWMQTGHSWNHQTWSPHIQALMDRRVLPAFSDEQFADGIEIAAQAMLNMAKAGPYGTPANPISAPRSGINLIDLEFWLSSPVPMAGKVILIVAGLGLVLLALGSDRHGQRWLLAGVYVMLLSLLFWPVLALTVLWALHRFFPNQRRPRGWGGHQLFGGAGSAGGSGGGAGGGNGGSGGGGAGGGGDF
ncbi:MAG TPA: TPM domain-containing protein [Halothiobacillaceae bacterium]|nr:TPM domain-containing protein [Halothiobacillaceae bacterium]